MTDEAKIEAMARAWNAWWSSVSTGASDKHMQCAFEAGYSAATEGMVPRVMLDDVAGLVERLEMSVAFDPPVLRKACKEAATAITSLASTNKTLEEVAQRDALELMHTRRKVENQKNEIERLTSTVADLERQLAEARHRRG